MAASIISDSDAAGDAAVFTVDLGGAGDNVKKNIAG
jgi:hypothetical protein